LLACISGKEKFTVKHLRFETSPLRMDRKTKIGIQLKEEKNNKSLKTERHFKSSSKLKQIKVRPSVT